MKLDKLIEAAPAKKKPEPKGKTPTEPVVPATAPEVPEEEGGWKKGSWNITKSIKDEGIKPSDVVFKEILQIVVKHTDIVPGQAPKINQQAVLAEIRALKGVNPYVLSKCYSSMRLFNDNLRIFLSEFKKQLGI